MTDNIAMPAFITDRQKSRFVGELKSQETYKAAYRAMKEHASEMQVIAMQLASILEVVSHLSHEDVCLGGRLVIEEKACELARELDKGLDSTNLPKVEDAS